MKKINYVLITTSALFPVVALAADVGAAIDKLGALVPNSTASITASALVVEFGLRLIKSDKPLSIMHALALCLHKLGNLAGSVGDYLDKILPQNLK